MATTMNRRLLAPEPAPILPTRRWLVYAILGTLVVHLCVLVVLRLVRVSAWELPSRDMSFPNTFRLNGVQQLPEEKGSPAPNPRETPGPRTIPVTAPAAPKMDLTSLERTLAVAAPPVLMPPTVDPAAATPVASLPSARHPSLLPRADKADSVPVSPDVAPIGLSDLPGASVPGDQAGTFSLPDVQPVALADEGLTALEGSGLGAGGTGTGLGVEFTDIDTLVTERVREDIESPEGLTIRLKEGVLFEFNSADLKPGAATALAKVRDVLAANPNADVRVDGHSDTFGSESYNLQLSERRAKAVGEWLLANGAKVNSLKMTGYGKARLLVRGGDRDTQRPNRRVEIHIKADKR
jgi:outer membrane protein OmpA-like peptidoglycan-associated protein